MRCITLLIASTLTLSACVQTPQNYLYRSNTTISQKDSDMFDCELDASRAVPVNTQIDTTPVYRTPVNTSCTSGYYGNVQCTSSGGDVYGGNTYSYDANTGLRDEYASRCMASKGYSVAQLPPCADNVVPAGAAQGLAGALRAPKDGACTVAITNRSSNVLYPEEFEK
jgi:hypothetical protein